MRVRTRSSAAVPGRVRVLLYAIEGPFRGERILGWCRSVGAWNARGEGNTWRRKFFRGFARKDGMGLARMSSIFSGEHKIRPGSFSGRKDRPSLQAAREDRPLSGGVEPARLRAALAREWEASTRRTDSFWETAATELIFFAGRLFSIEAGNAGAAGCVLRVSSGVSGSPRTARI